MAAFTALKGLNNKINTLHERCLRVVNNDEHSNFEELLNHRNSVCIHYNDMHALAAELIKVANMFLEIISEVFKQRDTLSYNLWQIHPIHSVITELNQHRI